MSDANTATAIKRLADAITPNVLGSKDASGGHVESLTEAIMGVTGGLCKIADAVESVAVALDAVAIAINERGT